MSKFTFVCQEEAMPFSDVVSSTRTVEFNADSLDNILLEFQQFLLGCGFSLPGQLGFEYDSLVENRYGEYSDTKFDFSEFPQNNWPFGDGAVGSLVKEVLPKGAVGDSEKRSRAK